MEVAWFIAEQALGLAVGLVGGMAYHQYRYRKIKRVAPSAKVTGFQVSLTEEDYKRIKKPEADVLYLTVQQRTPE